VNISKNVKVTLVKAYQGATTGDLNCDVIDMSGFEGVAFLGAILTANAGNYVKIQESDYSNAASAADLADTKLVTTNSGDAFFTELHKPLKRYCRAVVVRTASTAVGDVYALQYTSRAAAVSHGSTIASELNVSPIAGTA
jgi:hypothetical protein